PSGAEVRTATGSLTVQPPPHRLAASQSSGTKRLDTAEHDDGEAELIDRKSPSDARAPPPRAAHRHGARGTPPARAAPPRCCPGRGGPRRGPVAPPAPACPRATRAAPSRTVAARRARRPGAPTAANRRPR